MASLKKKFIGLYDKYHEGIYRFLYLRVSQFEIAQDLTSETFTKAWDALNKSNAEYPSNEKAYLFKIANNLLIDYYRSARRNRELSIGEPEVLASLASIEITTGSPEHPVVVGEGMDIKKDMDKVYLALQDMSEIYSEVISLKYVEDMSNAEIAEILGKSEGAIRTAISRGLAELKEKMG